MGDAIAWGASEAVPAWGVPALRRMTPMSRKDTSRRGDICLRFLDGGCEKAGRKRIMVEMAARPGAVRDVVFRPVVWSYAASRFRIPAMHKAFVPHCLARPPKAICAAIPVGGPIPRPYPGDDAPSLALDTALRRIGSIVMPPVGRGRRV